MTVTVTVVLDTLPRGHHVSQSL